MTMTTDHDLSSFLTTLSTEDKEALGAALCLVGPAMCMADGSISIRELIATIKAASAATETLGPGFENLVEHGKNGAEQLQLDMQRDLIAIKEKLASNPSAEELDAMKARTETFSSMTTMFAPHFIKAREILDRMPPDLRGAFDDFLATMLLRVAEASGGFLWWGEKISEQEREAARAMIAAFGISVRDPEVKKKFRLEA
jgi:hypothetical protein